MATRISTTEHRLLLGSAFIALALFFVFVALDTIEAQRLIALKKHNPFSSDVKIQLAGFHLMTLAIFVALAFSRKYVVSTILSGLYGGLIITSYCFRLNGEGSLGGEGFYTNPFREAVDKAHPFDFVAAPFILIAVVWQLTIFFRSYLTRSAR